MTDTTLLAHIVSRFTPRQWENVATEALAFLLRRPGADNVMPELLATLGIALPEHLRWRTQAGSAEDSSIPDLVGDDGQGRHAVIVEAKFWAGLTDNQPMGYLQRQDRQYADEPTASRVLVFLVPERRVDLIAAELAHRADIALDAVASVPVLRRGGAVHLAVVSWARMLAALDIQLRASGDDTGAWDLEQLRGLCDRADNETMLPLSPEDVGADRARRYLDFCDIVDRVADMLLSEGLVHARGLRTAHGKGWYGRWVATAAEDRAFRVTVSARFWSRDYPTPFWLRIERPSEEETTALHRMELEGAVQHVAEHNGNLMVGISPLTGAEGDEVVAHLAAVTRQVCAGFSAGRATPPRLDSDDDESSWHAGSHSTRSSASLTGRAPTASGVR